MKARPQAASKSSPASWVLRPAAMGYFTVAAAFLLAVCAVTFVTLKSFAETASWVAHTREVQTEIGNLHSGLSEAISAQRAFVITGQERYLTSYQAATRQTLERLRSLTTLTTDNPLQQDRLEDVGRV